MEKRNSSLVRVFMSVCCVTYKPSLRCKFHCTRAPILRVKNKNQPLRVNIKRADMKQHLMVKLQVMVYLSHPTILHQTRIKSTATISSGQATWKFKSVQISSPLFDDIHCFVIYSDIYFHFTKTPVIIRLPVLVSASRF